MEKKAKPNSTSPPQQEITATNLSTAITSSDQSDTGVTDKATTTPTSTILLVDVDRNKTVKQDTTSTIITNSMVNDNDTTTTATAARLLSTKKKRARWELYTNLVITTVTPTGSTKRTRSSGSSS